MLGPLGGHTAATVGKSLYIWGGARRSLKDEGNHTLEHFPRLVRFDTVTRTFDFPEVDTSPLARPSTSLLTIAYLGLARYPSCRSRVNCLRRCQRSSDLLATRTALNVPCSLPVIGCPARRLRVSHLERCVPALDWRGQPTKDFKVTFNTDDMTTSDPPCRYPCAGPDPPDGFDSRPARGWQDALPDHGVGPV